ncbi:hypothetical protein [Chryseolinea sp. H1M3-3]|uniref:hypothetical protein n=1 Tax=Chryseolinea sp. H1M3-3 TaxID=3034144 RepID=UPI0023EC2960|nr:hypothetical protein [Chryseolinea sp. H1M3-3]
MKRLSIHLLVLLLSFLGWSCQSSKILSASFEGDAINNPPNKNLPGDPAGDVIEYVNALEPQLKVQNSPIAGAKALHFTNVAITNPPGHQRWLSFKGVGTDLTKTIWFTHTGQNTGASHDLLIDVSDGHGHLMARMRIKSNGEVGLAKNITDDYTDVLGNIGSEVHTIIFTTSASTLKYNVTIFKTTGPAITAENKPMITDNALSFNNPAHPMLSFQHSEQSGSSHTYAIGSVTISKKKP